MEIKVKSLNHDELVNILSSGIYSNASMDAEYSSKEYEKIPLEARKGSCYEDKLADILLNGGKILLYDYEAEDADDIYGDKGKFVNGNAVYAITLQDILDACSTEEGIRYAVNLLVNEDGDFYDGYGILQLACFGEVVYG